MTSGGCTDVDGSARIRAMADEPSTTPAPDHAQPARCPWCSADLVDAAAATCVACGAILHAAEARSIPGVTEVDALAIARRPLSAQAPSFGSLLMGGVDTERPSPDQLPAIAPPGDAVRREMLRLEIDAERSKLEAEVGALEAEAALRRAEADALPPGHPRPEEPDPPASA